MREPMLRSVWWAPVFFLLAFFWAYLQAARWGRDQAKRIIGRWGPVVLVVVVPVGLILAALSVASWPLFAMYAGIETLHELGRLFRSWTEPDNWK